MAKKRHTTEQIISKLREAEVELAKGLQLPLVCRKLEVSEQTYYRWRKEYGGLRMDQARRPEGSGSGKHSAQEAAGRGRVGQSDPA